MLAREIDWFVLREGVYQKLSLADGLYKSEVFPGLWLDPEAMVSGDLATVLDTLRRGLVTPEHAALVERLTSSDPAA